MFVMVVLSCGGRRMDVIMETRLDCFGMTLVGIVVSFDWVCALNAMDRLEQGGCLGACICHGGSHAAEPI